MTVTASAISAILNRAGLRKANKKGWSVGFYVTQSGSSVTVWYQDRASTRPTLERIVEIINSREDRKYFASITVVDHSTTLIVDVAAYDETNPQQNEERKAIAQEKLAADHPAAPSIADVKKALRTYSQYDVDFHSGSGYKVERLEEDSRLVRVRFVETSYTAYGKKDTAEERDAIIAQTLANYARVVHQAGFEFQVRDDEMSVIVAMPGEWNSALNLDTVGTILRSSHTPWTEGSGGFTVGGYVDGAMRVQHHPFRTDDDETGYATVARYRKTLNKAGYDTVEDPSDDWALLVTVAAPPQPQEAPVAEESPEQVRAALLALREAVEGDEMLYSTRRAGDHSIFVMAIDMRVEVFYSNGEYKTKGRFGGYAWQRFSKIDSKLLGLIRSELGC